MKITALKAKRIKEGYKQEEFAQITHIAHRTYQNYENGRIPTLPNGIRIARKFNITTIDELERLFSVAEDETISHD